MLGVRVLCLRVWSMHPCVFGACGDQKAALDSPRLELQTVLSCCVGAMSQTWVHKKLSQCSQPLSISPAHFIANSVSSFCPRVLSTTSRCFILFTYIYICCDCSAVRWIPAACVQLLFSITLLRGQSNTLCASPVQDSESAGTWVHAAPFLSCRLPELPFFPLLMPYSPT